MIWVNEGRDQEARAILELAGLIRTSTGSGTIIASMCMQ